MSRMPEIFEDRREAGRFLASKLMDYASKRPVCAGLPRGGVVLAAQVADALGCVLDVIVAGKLRSPYNSELAIGAVTEDGEVYLNDDVIRSLRVTERYIEDERSDRLQVVLEKAGRYRQGIDKTSLNGRCVILVDDGLATGSTMISAAQAAHAGGAAEIIVAVPGGPRDTVARLRAMPEIARVICPIVPDVFYAVSQLYRDFSQTLDDEVVAILKEFALKNASRVSVK